jgi:hypothetical protein
VVLKLTVTERLKGRRLIAVTARGYRRTRRKIVVVGTATVTLASGQTRTVKLALNSAGRRLLAARHRLNATLHVVQVLPGRPSATVSTRTLAFKAAHRRHRH